MYNKTVRIGLHDVARTKPPVIEYHHAFNHWRVWLSYTPDMSAGTFYELHPDGSLHQTTIYPNGGIESTIIACGARYNTL